MNTHAIQDEIVVSRSDDSVVLECCVSADSDFFDGHFPEFKLFPAVGQIEVVSRFAKKYFNVGRCISSVKRMKFSSPIVPDEKVRVKLDYDSCKNSVSFKLWSPEDEAKVYSSGAFQAVKTDE